MEDRTSVHTGRHGVKLNANKPLLNVNMNLIPFDGKKFEVTGDSYYELTFWARRKGLSRIKLRVSVVQHDSSGDVIKQGATYSRQFNLKDSWKNFHLSIFTHNVCRKLKVVFKLSPVGEQTGIIYIDDVAFTRRDGSLLNVIKTAESNIMVKSADGNIIYKEGEDYTIEYSPFVITSPYEWKPKQRTKIKLIPESKIRKNEIIKVSYDCVILNPEEEGTRLCPSSPGTYWIYRDLFEDILVLNPKFINIDLDEYRGGYNRDSRCRKRNLSNGAIFAKFVNNLNDIIHGYQRKAGQPVNSIS